MGSPESDLLGALTHLTTHWSSARTQSAVTASAGVEIDAADIPPVYVLGLGGPQRSGDLATALRLSRPTMSKQISRLERAGLVSRIPDPADARATIIDLTPTGRVIHRSLVGEGLVMMTEALQGWDPQHRARFAADLTRFVDALTGTQG